MAELTRRWIFWEERLQGEQERVELACVATAPAQKVFWGIDGRGGPLAVQAGSARFRVSCGY